MGGHGLATFDRQQSWGTPSGGQRRTLFFPAFGRHESRSSIHLGSFRHCGKGVSSHSLFSIDAKRWVSLAGSMLVVAPRLRLDLPRVGSLGVYSRLALQFIATVAMLSSL